jgi:Uma2 family endonuclease
MVRALEQSEQVRQRAIPISVAAYHELGRQGLISEKTELLHGVIIEKMSKSPLHASTVRLLLELLSACLPADCFLLKEDPLTFVDSEPEPDLAVVPGNRSDYTKVHPQRAQLVIEVAVSTEDTDRLKAEIYAEAGIPEYWLVLPEKHQVDVFTQPQGSVYTVVQTFFSGGVIHSTVLPGLRVNADSLFGGG